MYDCQGVINLILHPLVKCTSVLYCCACIDQNVTKQPWTVWNALTFLLSTTFKSWCKYKSQRSSLVHSTCWESTSIAHLSVAQGHCAPHWVLTNSTQHLCNSLPNFLYYGPHQKSGAGCVGFVCELDKHQHSSTHSASAYSPAEATYSHNSDYTMSMLVGQSSVWTATAWSVPELLCYCNITDAIKEGSTMTPD